ncbi:MAG: PspC domain-containing protein [Treponema sp.]|nr:PspC domain-containing protein [Treponema sp.]
MKKLKKSNNKIICGVCGGVASYFNIDPTIVRILVVILSCIWGSGIIIYIAAALIMPPADTDDLNNDNIDNLKSANVNGEETGKSKSSSKATEKSGEDVPHTDSEFDEYFKK